MKYKRDNSRYNNNYRTKYPIKARANSLISAYKQMDRKYCRGKGDLTAQWLLENILFKPCTHCGICGWDLIGCNRIDNSKPHTKDNVEPCCPSCNYKLFGELSVKNVYQYTVDDQLVKIWHSFNELRRSGYSQGNIHMCCNGKRKTHKGYKWSYEPL